ncbi:MAG: hypothetical protein NC416_19355 [Eubacterium sp.]|nr:hypothetical protein [Eubacterium sp.]
MFILALLTLIVLISQ